MPIAPWEDCLDGKAMPMRRLGKLASYKTGRVAASTKSQIGIARHDERPPCERNPARERAPDALTCRCAGKTASLMAGEPVLLPGAGAVHHIRVQTIDFAAPRRVPELPGAGRLTQRALSDWHFLHSLHEPLRVVREPRTSRSVVVLGLVRRGAKRQAGEPVRGHSSAASATVSGELLSTSVTGDHGHGRPDRSDEPRARRPAATTERPQAWCPGGSQADPRQHPAVCFPARLDSVRPRWVRLLLRDASTVLRPLGAVGSGALHTPLRCNRSLYPPGVG